MKEGRINMKKQTIYGVISAISFILSIIGFIAFIKNNEFLNSSAATIQVHNSLAKLSGGLTAETMNAIAIIGLIASIVFLVLGIIFIFKFLKSKRK